MSKTSKSAITAITVTPEPDSLRDVLLFCAVLLVEIYSLSVALGGPFLEVGYFLLVVISQTIAGAYIWARLREDERILPLPELLAMGFAIGSASAAISQLIVRDLLGVRLFISPLIPVIAVLIWRTIKKNARLPVQISHAKTNTLLWLLLPAPLSIASTSWPMVLIVPLFMIPLAAITIYFYRFQAETFSRLIPRTATKIVVSVVLLSIVYGSIFQYLTNLGDGISRIIGNDSRFDISNAVSSSTWGYQSNSELSGQSIAYFKISHLWLGPIIRGNGIIGISIAETLLPILLITFVGISIWSITNHLSLNLRAAGLASVLFFVQASIADSPNFNLRLVWLFVIFYLVAFGFMTLLIMNKKIVLPKIFIASSAFFIAGTRITFIPQIIAIANMNTVLIGTEIWNFARRQIKIVILTIAGTLIALVIFTFGEQSTNLNKLIFGAGKWPVSKITSLSWVAQTSVGRVLPFVLIVFVAEKFKPIRAYTIMSALIYLVTSIFQPRLYHRDADFLIPYLVLMSPIIALAVTESLRQLRSPRLWILITSATFLGAFHGVIFDLTKRRPPEGNWLRTSLFFIAEREILTSLLLLFSGLVITICFFMSYKLRNPLTFACCLSLIFFSLNFGVQVSIFLSPITENLRYGDSLFTSTEDPLIKRWKDPDRLSGVSKLEELSDKNDIVAANFGLYKNIGPDDDYRISLLSKRRTYISGRYQYLSKDFYLIFKQNYSSSENGPNSAVNFAQMLRERIDTSIYFPTDPSKNLLANLQKANVKWFAVDLGNTPLRTWEPWATTRFINEKVAILELAQLPAPSN